MKKNRKILAVALVLALALAALIPAAAFAAETTGEVACTVSGKLISATITSDGTVAYGTLELSATKNTVLYDESTNPNGMTLADTQTAENNGTVPEDLKIKSSDASGGTPWTLGAVQGDNTFTHKASINGGSTWEAMTAADEYVVLKGNVAVDGTQTFDLEIGMPSTITDYSAKTITVTIGASEYTA